MMDDIEAIEVRLILLDVLSRCGEKFFPAGCVWPIQVLSSLSNIDWNKIKKIPPYNENALYWVLNVVPANNTFPIEGEFRFFHTSARAKACGVLLGLEPREAHTLTNAQLFTG